MNYYKILDGGYILAIGIGSGGKEITEQEYNEIMSVIQTKPVRTDTTDYRLRMDMTWEPYPVEPPEPDPEVDEVEAFDIIFGGAE